MKQTTPSSQLSLFEDEQAEKKARIEAYTYRYKGDPYYGGKDMKNRCAHTYPELGGMQCLLRTNEVYCDVCVGLHHG